MQRNYLQSSDWLLEEMTAHQLQVRLYANAYRTYMHMYINNISFLNLMKCLHGYNICLLLLSAKADLVGTIILNPSAMSTATLSITDDDKIYHLVSECIIRVFSHDMNCYRLNQRIIIMTKLEQVVGDRS